MTREVPRFPPLGTPAWHERAGELAAALNSPEARAARERLGQLGRQLAEAMQRIRLRWTCAAAMLALDEGDEAKAVRVLTTLRNPAEREMVADLAALSAADAEAAAEVAAAGRRVAELLAADLAEV